MQLLTWMPGGLHLALLERPQLALPLGLLLNDLVGLKALPHSLHLHSRG